MTVKVTSYRTGKLAHSFSTAKIPIAATIASFRLPLLGLAVIKIVVFIHIIVSLDPTDG